MKTKFYRVAQSGPTIDGREITPAQIDQMAESYNPETYGARIWIEHLRSLLPADTPFKAYGDVLALKAETDAEGRRVLLAQVDATDDLVELSKARQKVFWSIEMDPNFASTGKAYMAGLAVTDTPASLGTEMLKFAVAHSSTLPAAQALPNRLYSTAIEAALEEDSVAAPLPPEGPTLLARVKEILGGQKAGDTARFTQIEESITVLADGLSKITAALDAMARTKPADAPVPSVAPPSVSTPDAPVTRQEFDALIQKLGSTSPTQARPPHGGDTARSGTVTDC